MTNQTETINNDTIDTGFNGINPELMPPRENMSVFTLDEEKANELLEYNAYHQQRKLKGVRLKELCRKAQDGRFHGGEIAVANLTFPYLSEENDVVREHTKLLMNGQHQCELVKQTGIPQQTVLKEFNVTDADQLAVLFAQFDQPGGVRTPAQVAAAFQSIIKTNGVSWGNMAIRTVASAIGNLMHDEENYTNSRKLNTIDERIESMLLPEYWPHAEWCYKIVWDWEDGTTKKCPHLARQPVVASMILCHIREPEEANEFWSKIATGANLEASSAALALFNWLVKISVGNSGSASRSRNLITAVQVYDKCKQLFFENHLENRPTERVRLTRPRIGRPSVR